MKRRKSAGNWTTPGRWSVYRVRAEGDELVKSGLTFDQAVELGDQLVVTTTGADRISLREDWVASWGTGIHRS